MRRNLVLVLVLAVATWACASPTQSESATASSMMQSPSPSPTIATQRPTPRATPTAISTPAPSPKPKPTATPPPWLAVNEAAYIVTSTGDGAIKVSDFKKLGSTCGYSSAGRGNRFVGVMVVYVGDGVFYSSFDWQGHDERNRQYETTYAGLCYDEADMLGSGQLGSGTHTYGIVLFKVPKTAKHFYVDWHEMFSATRQSWKLW